MSIGVATICNRGENIICVTDGMLSAEVCSDASAFKMQIFGDWVFMFAGTLSNADLIMEELRKAVSTDETVLSREKIQSSIKQAYVKRRSEWVADRILAPYDLTMDEFKADGLKMFGEKVFSELDMQIRQDTQNFNEYIMVAGWGLSGKSPMVYAVRPEGSTSSALDGFETIGCGAGIAQNTLMLLKCARHMPFEYALYSAAAAKFASESCEGVGRSTVIAVIQKPTSRDEKWFKLIQPEQQDKIRELWDRYSKPRIPVEALPTLCLISQEIMGCVSPEPAIKAIADSLKSAGILKLHRPA